MKCAFLDMDNTLVKTGYREYLVGVPAKYLADKMSIEHEKAISLLRSKVREIMREKIISGDYLLAFDWDYIIPEALKKFGVEIKEFNALSLLLSAVENGATYVYEDTIDAIEEMRERYVIGIVTGGLSKYQDAILDRLGIRELFDYILTTDRLGYLKVRPEAFWEAMRICGCTKAFHVGDSLSHDVGGGKAAGIPVLLMARKWSWLRQYDPFQRVTIAINKSVLREEMSKDILYGYIPEELMIPDAIVIEMGEVPSIARDLEKD